jgi:Ser/Thr protein kinase RdoA (MazF antagonist)
LPHSHNAAQKFTPQAQIFEVREYGQGNVNDTFLVTVEEVAGSAHPTSEEMMGSAHPTSAAAGPQRFILQRLNTRVFPRPELIMGNLRVFSEHVEARLAKEPLPPERRWDPPRVLLTGAGEDHWRDPDGFFWRALTFVADAESHYTVKDLDHAREVGWALGLFHKLISDLPPTRLADTLPGFHVTPGYLRRYDGVLGRLKEGRENGKEAPATITGQAELAAPHRPGLAPGALSENSPEAAFCRRFVEARRTWAAVLEDAKTKGELPLRPIHGDPKVNNVMVDTATGKAVCLVDLDTVKPGLVHYDLGDCLRSGCNTLGEEIGNWEQARFETEICRAVLRGYLSQAGDFLTPKDYDYLFDAVRLLPFELGLRFFTDYLEDNVYFKVRYPEHNLLRALVQFRLTESIETQEGAIRTLIRDFLKK